MSLQVLQVQEIVRLVSVIEVEKVMHVLQLSFQVEVSSLCIPLFKFQTMEGLSRKENLFRPSLV
jgi:hypothetical protein